MSDWLGTVDKRILVVDFDGEDLGALRRALEAEGLVAIAAQATSEVLERWGESHIDAVLLAVDVRNERHREVVSAVRSFPGGQIPILFFGGAEDAAPIRAPSEALSHGGDYFFRLPCDLAYLAGRARTWAQRGTRGPEPALTQAPPPTREAPELEGFRKSLAGVHLPALDRLRASGHESNEDWAWVDELDEAQPLDATGGLGLDRPISFDAYGDPVPLEEVVSGPAFVAGEARGEEAREGAGVGDDEQAALLSGMAAQPDPLEELRIEEVDESEVVSEIGDDVIPSYGPRNGAATFARIKVGGGKEGEGPTLSPPMWNQVGDVSDASPAELIAKLPVAEPLDETLFMDVEGLPEAPRDLGDEPLERGFEPMREASERKGTASPRSVSFPKIDPETSPVVSPRRVSKSGNRISNDTLAALKALLEGGSPREPPADAGTAPPASGGDFAAEEPTMGLAAADREALVQSVSEAAQSDLRPEEERDPPGVYDFETDEPTLNLEIPSPSVLPVAPIGEDEDTQELLYAPLVAASGGGDFPPGALGIVEQSEAQRQRGAIDEACAGYALAAQIYIDHSLWNAAKSLYKQILRLMPDHPFAAERLAGFDAIPVAPGLSDEIVLEFVEDLPVASVELSEPPAALIGLSEERNLDFEQPSAQELLLGRLSPSGLQPSQGRLETASDVVQLFLRARAQRCTGILHFEGLAALFVAHGVPAGLVGEQVIPSFLRLLADIGRIGESRAQELARAPHQSPRALARRLTDRCVIDVEEEILLPTRHLEDHLIRCLQHRGTWYFEANTAGMNADDLVPRVGDLRDWLVELLPRATAESELRAVLALGRDTIRIVPGTEHFVGNVDAPVSNLLEGRRGLSEAARLAGVPAVRAFAWALVWLQEGLAERVLRPASGLAHISELPAAQPKTNPSAAWPSNFRLERTRASSKENPRSTPSEFVLDTSIESVGGTDSPGSMTTEETAFMAPTTSAEAAPLASAKEGLLASLESEARVRAMAEMVRTHDYFGILDIDASATRKAIDDAHQRMRNLVPEDVGDDLESMVQEVLRSVDEARDVLIIPELRAAYEHHLEPRL